MSRSIIPDLDALESPLLSPTPLTGLAGVPGSAIAEKIFNDPHSWDDTSGDEGDYPEDIESDTLAWFTEEIEKLRRQSAGIGRDDYDIVRRESKETDLAPKREGNTGWKDIARRGSVRPISLAGLFEQSDDDFSKEIQQHLSKMLDSVGPKSSSYTTGSMTTPSTAESIATPLTSSSEMSPSVYPASATLSFLEYYGIYPDSPLFDGRKLLRNKSLRRPPLSKDSQAGNLRSARVTPTETFGQSPPPRLSSGPPPGLDLPFKTRPSPPGHTTSDGPKQASPSHSRNNSDVQGVVVSPPSDSSPRSRPLPIATGISPTSSSADSSPVRVRRLPSIPSEPQPQLSSISPPDQILSGRTTPPSQPNAPASAAFLSPSSKSSVAIPSASLASAASQSLRTPIPIRSPLGVPLGPRTRGRSSDAARQLATIQPC